MFYLCISSLKLNYQFANHFSKTPILNMKFFIKMGYRYNWSLQIQILDTYYNVRFRLKFLDLDQI